MLSLTDISKSFDATRVLQHIDLDVAPGEILCLLGASGSGKSTLLRIVAGLEKPDSGTLRLDGRSLDGVPVHERGFGLMFQEFALFPHRNVAANVAFGLRMAGLEKSVIARRVEDALALVGLTGYGNRDVSHLSGGEKQRVALARSIAPRPNLLMLDEPLGSLDRGLREQLGGEIRDIVKRLELTSIYVTHDQTEAFGIADRVALLHHGAIEQIAAPRVLYQKPATRYVAGFLGLTNVFEGRIIRVSNEAFEISTDLGKITVAQTDKPVDIGRQVAVIVRPEAGLSAGEAGTGLILEGDVIKRAFRGSTERVTVRHASGATVELDMLPFSGDRIRLVADQTALSVLPS